MMAFLSEKCVNDITIGPGWRMLKVLQVESTLLGFPHCAVFFWLLSFFWASTGRVLTYHEDPLVPLREP